MLGASVVWEALLETVATAEMEGTAGLAGKQLATDSMRRLDMQVATAPGEALGEPVETEDAEVQVAMEELVDRVKAEPSQCSPVPCPSFRVTDQAMRRKVGMEEMRIMAAGQAGEEQVGMAAPAG